MAKDCNPSKSRSGRPELERRQNWNRGPQYERGIKISVSSVPELGGLQKLSSRTGPDEETVNQ